MHNWVSGPLKPALSSHEVHIWRLKLPISEPNKIQFKKKLNLQECLRWDSFHFQKDKDQFLAGRGVLREIISRYLEISANEICFDYTEFGKPYLKEVPLKFNLAHSENYVLYAFSINNLLGIDVERIKENIDYISIAKETFTKNEYEEFLDFPESEKLLAFYRCWTRKEATIKMIGKGLSFPLKRLQVGFSVEDEIQLLDIELLKPFLLPLIKNKEASMKMLEERPQWSLKEIKLEADYAAAIVAEKKYLKISFWDW